MTPMLCMDKQLQLMQLLLAKLIPTLFLIKMWETLLRHLTQQNELGLLLAKFVNLAMLIKEVQAGSFGANADAASCLAWTTTIPYKSTS